MITMITVFLISGKKYLLFGAIGIKTPRNRYLYLDTKPVFLHTDRLFPDEKVASEDWAIRHVFSIYDV